MALKPTQPAIRISQPRTGSSFYTQPKFKSAMHSFADAAQSCGVPGPSKTPSGPGPSKTPAGPGPSKTPAPGKSPGPSSQPGGTPGKTPSPSAGPGAHPGSSPG